MRSKRNIIARLNSEFPDYYEWNRKRYWLLKLPERTRFPILLSFHVEGDMMARGSDIIYTYSVSLPDGRVVDARGCDSHNHVDGISNNSDVDAVVPKEFKGDVKLMIEHFIDNVLREERVHLLHWENTPTEELASATN